MGPLSADSQPPPSSADSAWFLTQNSGFAGQDDETGLPPLNPPGSSNRKPQRNSDFDFRFFAVSTTAKVIPERSVRWAWEFPRGKKGNRVNTASARVALANYSDDWPSVAGDLRHNHRWSGSSSTLHSSRSVHNTHGWELFLYL